MERQELIRIAEICSKHNTSCKECRLRKLTFCCEYLIGELLEYIKKHDKYRWHDLQKNPGDLPQEKKEYEIWYKAINPAYTGKKISFWNGKEFLLRRNNTGEVVAWRESEPFEEGE